MLNHITIMGRLTRDPELRYTPSQTPVTSFTLAVDRDYTNRDTNERQTDFIDCVAWRSAEFVSKYFQKGSLAVVSGRLQIRDWTDRDGNKRWSTDVVVSEQHFAESKASSSANGDADRSRDFAPRQQRQYNAPAPQANDGFAPLDDDIDEDLPF